MRYRSLLSPGRGESPLQPNLQLRAGGNSQRPRSQSWNMGRLAGGPWARRLPPVRSSMSPPPTAATPTGCMSIPSYDPDPATSHDGMTQPQTAREELRSVLAREGADLSAHETRAPHATRGGGLHRSRERVPHPGPRSPTARLRWPARPLQAQPGRPGRCSIQRRLRAAHGRSPRRRSPRPRRRGRVSKAGGGPDPR